MTDQKRSIAIGLSVTPTERLRWGKIAEREGVPIHDLIRRVFWTYVKEQEDRDRAVQVAIPQVTLHIQAPPVPPSPLDGKHMVTVNPVGRKSGAVADDQMPLVGEPISADTQPDDEGPDKPTSTDPTSRAKAKAKDKAPTD